MTDSVLLIHESGVARGRGRSVGSIIESSSQADLMKMPMKEVFTQRNSSQFEVVEDIVSSREQASVRERVATRRRGRGRERDRGRGRERPRGRGRGDRGDISASTEIAGGVEDVIEDGNVMIGDVSEVIQ